MLDERNKSLVDRLKAKEQALALQTEQFQVAMSRMNAVSRFEPVDENKDSDSISQAQQALQEIRAKRISDYQQRIEQRKKAINDMEALRLKSVYSLHKQQCFELADTHFKARVYRRFMLALFSYTQLSAQLRHVYMRTNIFLQRKAVQTMYNLLAISRHQHLVSVLHHFRTAGGHVMTRLKEVAAESEHQVKLTILAEYRHKMMCYRRLVRRLKYTKQYQQKCVAAAERRHTQSIKKGCMLMFKHFCKRIHPVQHRVDIRTYNYLVHTKYRALKRWCLGRLRRTHTDRRNVLLGDLFYTRRSVFKAFGALRTNSTLSRHINKHIVTVDKLREYSQYTHALQQWMTFKRHRSHEKAHIQTKVHAHLQRKLRVYLKLFRAYSKHRRESRQQAYKRYLQYKYEVVYKNKFNKYTVQNILTQAMQRYTLAMKPSLASGNAVSNRKGKAKPSLRKNRAVYSLSMYIFAYWRRWRKWVGGRGRSRNRVRVAVGWGDKGVYATFLHRLLTRTHARLSMRSKLRQSLIAYRKRHTEHMRSFLRTLFRRVQKRRKTKATLHSHLERAYYATLAQTLLRLKQHKKLLISIRHYTDKMKSHLRAALAHWLASTRLKKGARQALREAGESHLQSVLRRWRRHIVRQKGLVKLYYIGKRFFVYHSVYGKFMQHLRMRVEKKRRGGRAKGEGRLLARRSSSRRTSGLGAFGSWLGSELGSLQRSGSKLAVAVGGTAVQISPPAPPPSVRSVAASAPAPIPGAAPRTAISKALSLTFNQDEDEDVYSVHTDDSLHLPSSHLPSRLSSHPPPRIPSQIPAANAFPTAYPPSYAKAPPHLLSVASMSSMMSSPLLHPRSYLPPNTIKRHLSKYLAALKISAQHSKAYRMEVYKPASRYYKHQVMAKYFGMLRDKYLYGVDVHNTIHTFLHTTHTNLLLRKYVRLLREHVHTRHVYRRVYMTGEDMAVKVYGKVCLHHWRHVCQGHGQQHVQVDRARQHMYRAMSVFGTDRWKAFVQSSMGDRAAMKRGRRHHALRVVGASMGRWQQWFVMQKDKKKRKQAVMRYLQCIFMKRWMHYHDIHKRFRHLHTRHIHSHDHAQTPYRLHLRKRQLATLRNNFSVLRHKISSIVVYKQFVQKANKLRAMHILKSCFNSWVHDVDVVGGRARVQKGAKKFFGTCMGIWKKYVRYRKSCREYYLGVGKVRNQFAISKQLQHWRQNHITTTQRKAKYASKLRRHLLTKYLKRYVRTWSLQVQRSHNLTDKLFYKHVMMGSGAAAVSGGSVVGTVVGLVGGAGSGSARGSVRGSVSVPRGDIYFNTSKWRDQVKGEVRRFIHSHPTIRTYKALYKHILTLQRCRRGWAKCVGFAEGRGETTQGEAKGDDWYARTLQRRYFGVYAQHLQEKHACDERQRHAHTNYISSKLMHLVHKVHHHSELKQAYRLQQNAYIRDMVMYFWLVWRCRVVGAVQMYKIHANSEMVRSVVSVSGGGKSGSGNKGRSVGGTVGDLLLCHRVHTILTHKASSATAGHLDQYSFVTPIRRLLGAHMSATNTQIRSPPSFSLQDAHVHMASQHYTQKLFLCMWRRFKRIYKAHALQKRVLIHLAHLQPPSSYHHLQRSGSKNASKAAGKAKGKGKQSGEVELLAESRVSYRDIHCNLVLKHAMHRFTQHLVATNAARAEQKRSYGQHLQRKLLQAFRTFKQRTVDRIRTKRVQKLLLKRYLRYLGTMYGKVKRSRKILRYFSQQQSYIFLDRAMRKWKEDTLFERNVEKILVAHAQSRQRYALDKFLQRLATGVSRRKQTQQAAKYHRNSQRQRFAEAGEQVLSATADQAGCSVLLRIHVQRGCGAVPVLQEEAAGLFAVSRQGVQVVQAASAGAEALQPLPSC